MEEQAIQALISLVRKEPFPKFMGIQVLKVEPGYALVEMRVTKEMANIHGIGHGGALFSLVDEAFELASNSHGNVAVALNMNITFYAPTPIGEVIRAEAVEVFSTKRTASYQIIVKTTEGRQLANCQALVYRKKEPLSGPSPSSP